MRDWKEGSDCCLWDGVTCNMETGHVVSLDLSNSRLDGCPLRSNSSLFRLLHLEKLSLAYNHFNSCLIPAQFGQLSRIFQLPNLQIVDLSCNGDLIGSLPEFHSGSNLMSLQLQQTKFEGKIRNSVGNLKSLKVLSLSECKFSGPVPHSLWNLSQLSYLSLSSNYFNGQLPSSLNLAKITQLHLENNEFSGEFPSSLNLPHLKSLDVSDNNFRNNYFHGSFPLSLPYLLEEIGFHNTSLTGPIPSRAFNNLTFLSSLDLSTNSLNGVIPSSLLTLPPLEFLILDDNQFIGLESILISNSSQLFTLTLGGNKLNGHFPTSIFKLNRLTNLYLNSNNLSGRVDLGIVFSELSMLNNLDLSYNSLSLTTNVSMNVSALPKFKYLQLSSCNLSEFPDFLKAQNELVRLDLSHNIIRGPIPKWFLSIATMNLRWLSLSHNFISGWEEVPLVLDLSSNMLHGPLVVPPMSTFYFSISNNSLTGTIDPLFCNLWNLRVLDASSNRLGGSIPQCLGNWGLAVLNL
nr:receptor-like protein 6 [Ziziphus jujuba var. spinosa]